MKKLPAEYDSSGPYYSVLSFRRDNEKKNLTTMKLEKERGRKI